MRLTYFLTDRFIKSKKRTRFISAISLITIIGIAIGVTVVIMALTVLDGFNHVVSRKIVEMNSHIKITGFSNKPLPGPEFFNDELTRSFGGKIAAIEPFISKLAIIKSKNLSEGVTIIGMSKKDIWSNLNKFLINSDTNFSSSNSAVPIFIGKKLAEKLFVKTGGKVFLFSIKNDKLPSIDNPPVIKEFFVAGIFESGISEYDDLNAYIEMDAAREMFGITGDVSGYNIKVSDITKVETLAERMQDFLGYPFYVRSIFKVHQNIFMWLELQKKPIPIILGLIIFVAVFNIIGTLLMIVLERTNSIGILRSLGFNRNKIIKMFLINGAYITFWGVLTGNLLALILSVLQDKFDIISLPNKIYFVTRVPISIDINNYLLITAITIVISMTASLMPAWIASKITPLKAIRFD
ncbi:MAG: FtsX-like permease family protein [Bacteroidota bacterium]